MHSHAALTNCKKNSSLFNLCLAPAPHLDICLLSEIVPLENMEVKLLLVLMAFSSW